MMGPSSYPPQFDPPVKAGDVTVTLRDVIIFLNEFKYLGHSPAHQSLTRLTHLVTSPERHHFSNG